MILQSISYELCINIKYDIMGGNIWYYWLESMISLAYDIICPWYHTKYHMKSLVISYMISWPRNLWFQWLMISYLDDIRAKFTYFQVWYNSWFQCVYITKERFAEAATGQRSWIVFIQHTALLQLQWWVKKMNNLGQCTVLVVWRNLRKQASLNWQKPASPSVRVSRFLSSSNTPGATGRTGVACIAAPVQQSRLASKKCRWGRLSVP